MSSWMSIIQGERSVSIDLLQLVAVATQEVQMVPFMERMSLYMPGHHRAFLSHLRNISFDDREDDDIEDDLDLASDDDETSSDAPEVAEARELPHPIRSLALKAKTEDHDEGLPAAYDNALRELKGLRDEHMKIAYLYIVAQARGSPLTPMLLCQKVSRENPPLISDSSPTPRQKLMPMLRLKRMQHSTRTARTTEEEPRVQVGLIW